MFTDDDSNEFFGKVKESDFEDGDFSTFRITRLEGEEQAFFLDCSVTIEDEPNFHENWRLSFDGVRHSTVALGPVDYFEMADDHILLKEYSDLQCRLGFKGKIAKSSSLVGELYRAHVALAEDWIPFESYLNPEIEITQLLDNGFGTLAFGPKTFIEVYETVLKSNGIQTSITGESVREEWIDGGLKELPKLTAFIFNDRYVIAEKATARKNH